jgi:hypothetical protein
MIEAALWRPPPQSDPAFCGVATAEATDPDQAQDEAVRRPRGKRPGNVPALDAESDWLRGFDEVPPLGHLSEQSQGNKSEYFCHKRGA